MRYFSSFFSHSFSLSHAILQCVHYPIWHTKYIHFMLKWQQQSSYSFKFGFPLRKKWRRRRRRSSFYSNQNNWYGKKNDEKARITNEVKFKTKCVFQAILIPFAIRYHSKVQSPKYTKHAFWLFSFIDTMSSGSFLLILFSFVYAFFSTWFFLLAHIFFSLLKS